MTKQELYEKIWDALDRIDGEFTRQQLIEVCEEIGEDYKYVSDELDTTD